MNYLLIILCFLLQSKAFATSKSKQVAYGFPVHFLSGEFIPNYKVKLVFEFPHCALDSHFLKIVRSDSMAKLKSTQTGKKVLVRYVHLVGRLSGNHKDCSAGVNSVQLNYEIEADPTKMTHFFIMVEQPTVIKSIQNIVQ